MTLLLSPSFWFCSTMLARVASRIVVEHRIIPVGACDDVSSCRLVLVLAGGFRYLVTTASAVYTDGTTMSLNERHLKM